MQKPEVKNTLVFLKKVKRKMRSILRGIKRVEHNLWVYSPFSLPVHHMKRMRGVNTFLLLLQVKMLSSLLRLKKTVVWVACPAACDVALRLKKDKLVYQRTDCFEEYPNVDKDTIFRYDRQLKREADITLFVNRMMYENEKQQCKKALFIDHGVDYEFFAGAENNNIFPEDIRHIKRPIVGFFGGIDNHTSDIPFVSKVIEMMPDINFVFVGSMSVAPEPFMKKNVYSLGPKPHEQIPDYGKHFDVAIMPWRQSKWIESCNPIKLKEYLALGKPIVSTPFLELEYYKEHVYVARTPEGFVDSIRKALAEDCEEKREQRKARVQKATWATRVDMLLDQLYE
jgi:glycosyltransferase involved in cell wall biosynthesis